MKRTKPRAALTLAGALLLAGCGLGAEPEPTPTIPERWGLDEALPEAGRVEAKQDVFFHGPRGCRTVTDDLRGLSGTFAGSQPSFPFEFGRYVDGDLTVGYFVVWTDFESRSAYTTAEKTATRIVGDLDGCVADVHDWRKYYGTWTFERFGSVEDLRFGWYESSAKPPDWVERPIADPPSLPRESPTPTTFQTQGRYAIVNGWLVVGVEASVEDETTDLPAAVDIDTLLDHLVAEVKADPITKDEYRHRFDHLHDGEDDDSGPRSPLDQLKDNVNPATG